MGAARGAPVHKYQGPLSGRFGSFGLRRGPHNQKAGNVRYSSVLLQSALSFVGTLGAVVGALWKEQP